MRHDGTWDIRVNDELKQMFPKPKFSVYSIPEGQKLVGILSNLYNIPTANVLQRPKADANVIARYLAKGVYYRSWAIIAQKYPALFDANGVTQEATILINRPAHFKSVAHEFYHHLDYSTNHAFVSDDNFSGPSSLSWQFAERFWALMRGVEYKTSFPQGKILATQQVLLV